MAAKTATILIRLTPDDRARLQRVADAEFLEAATWARQAVLRMLQQAERAQDAAAGGKSSKSSAKRARQP
jgi:hypothetical protein